MRKILLVAMLTMLSSCTVIDAYLMTHYDPNEYNNITVIRADAGQFKTKCDDAVASRANADRIAYETTAFKLYSENIPKNDDNYQAATALNDIAQGLVDRYNKGEGDPAFNEAGAFLHDIWFTQLHAPRTAKPTGKIDTTRNVKSICWVGFTNTQIISGAHISFVISNG